MGSGVFIRLLTTNHFLCTMHSILKGLNSNAQSIYPALCYCISHWPSYKILSLALFRSEIYSLARSLTLYMGTHVPVSQLSEAPLGA